MKWNRSRDTLLNGVVGALLGYAVARWRGREDRLRIALIVGAVFASINWLTYGNVDDLEELSEEIERSVEEQPDSEEQSDEE